MSKHDAEERKTREAARDRQNTASDEKSGEQGTKGDAPNEAPKLDASKIIGNG